MTIFLKNIVLFLSGLSMTWIFLSSYTPQIKSNHSHIEFEELNSHADLQHDHEEIHVHKHRHGENGEEHEHFHGVQVEIKPLIVMNVSTFNPQYHFQVRQADWFYRLEKEKHYISELLRPPQFII